MKLRNVNDRWFMKTLVKGNDGIFKHFFTINSVLSHLLYICLSCLHWATQRAKEEEEEEL